MASWVTWVAFIAICTPTPELSLQERRTANQVADRLRQVGFDVTIAVGGTGVVGCSAMAVVRRSCCERTWMRFR